LLFENVSILIPYKPDSGIRDININWIKCFYETLFPEVEICIGISTENLFNRAKAINLAAIQATRDIFVIADGDIFYDPEVIKDSISHLRQAPWVIPFRFIVRISKNNSREVVNSKPTWPLDITENEIIHTSKYTYLGGLNVITREAFMSVGGFDERFNGWGGEDDAFGSAVNTMCGHYERLEHTIYHLWHPSLDYSQNPNGKKNLQIRELYYRAVKNKQKMEEVLSDAKGIFRNNIIRIVTVTNDIYAKHLAVMLKSLLKNKKSINPIKIYVINSNISDSNIALLKKTVKKYGAKIKFKNIDTSLYSGFSTLEYITLETYYRLSIPDLFEDRIDKVIYLDSDIILNKDISKLWNIDVSEYYLGAVEDSWVRNSRNSDLGMPENSKYFNAGVLLINLKKWREHDIKNQVIDYINTNPSTIKFCDQDALNAVLHDKWLYLDTKWNYQTYHYMTNPNSGTDPAIIHYTGGGKPWNSNHPLKKYYYKYS